MKSTIVALATGVVLLGGIAAEAKKNGTEFARGYCRIAQASEQAKVSKRARPSGGNTMAASIHIHATSDVVWRAIHEERSHDPDLAYSKVLNQNGPELVLEQKFAILPIIGTAVCVMTNKEVENRKIEYKLVKSDHFKAMEGSWEILPTDDNRCSELTLTSYVDLGLNVPRMFMDDITSKKLQRRLSNVKKAAETEQSKLAAEKKEVSSNPHTANLQ